MARTQDMPHLMSSVIEPRPPRTLVMIVMVVGVGMLLARHQANLTATKLGSESQTNRNKQTTHTGERCGADAFGSICFLVASGLALAQVCHKLWCWKPNLITLRIAAINLAGSIAFGISAIGAWVVPETGDLNNATVANAFTFIGAVMFFIGALLLIPAMSTARNQSSST